jgi:hypothetical protein
MPPLPPESARRKNFLGILKITLYIHVQETYNEKLYKAYNNGRKTAIPSGECRFSSKTSGFSAVFAEKLLL